MFTDLKIIEASKRKTGLAALLQAALVSSAFIMGSLGVAQADDLSNAYAVEGESAYSESFDEAMIEEHPLNDAWMGMTVETADGQVAGYVSDAVMAPNGDIETLFITPGGEGRLNEEIVIDARNVQLNDWNVTTSYTLRALASLQTPDEYLQTASLVE
ncbi:PRC-barrel domain-containing protein [Ahrensia kielensis]|uniref:PRC-barrel domain-containing protein n=1 Tax=Ahrensia kielensis TaxID=76980 RepID=A0ABU9T6M4_9HYPH